MKLSDYVVQFLEKKGVKDVFLLSGGGIMHLLNSLAENENIHKYYNLHEQGSGFCADAYAQYSNKIGVCFATTGPGATNVITALASAYIDSTPMLVISGQVKTADLTKIPGVRQTGAQEVGIVPIVESVTKYAVTIENEIDIRYHLEKAVYLAKHERPGPVWIDIPLDIQAKEIEPEQLTGFTAMLEPKKAAFELTDIEEIYQLIQQAKRPCILAGTGIILSDGTTDFLKLVNLLKVPVVTSRRVKRLFHKENGRYYYGSVGAVAPRYANYVLQNSDLLIVIGSGLRYYITAYNEQNFAPKAKKIIINIHKAEIDKLRMPVEKAIVCDAKNFIQELSRYASKQIVSTDSNIKWITYCDTMRDKYTAEKEIIPHDDGLPDGYLVSQAVDRYAKNDEVYVASPSAYAYTYNVYQLKGQQDYICPLGLGSMGTALPAAIGACIASGRRRTIVGEGDGSLQHNIQELALLKQYQLPIKIFIDNNDGYRQIYTMQKSHFSSRFAGCNPESGITFPELKTIADAYKIKYYCIKRVQDIDQEVKKALADDEPAIIEIFSSPQVEFVPIIKSKIGVNGEMLSSRLEDLYPFLPDKEQTDNMKISTL